MPHGSNTGGAGCAIKKSDAIYEFMIQPQCNRTRTRGSRSDRPPLTDRTTTTVAWNTLRQYRHQKKEMQFDRIGRMAAEERHSVKANLQLRGQRRTPGLEAPQVEFASIAILQEQRLPAAVLRRLVQPRNRPLELPQALMRALMPAASRVCPA